MKKTIANRRAHKRSEEKQVRWFAKKPTSERAAPSGHFEKRAVDPETGLYIIPLEDLDKVPG